jgi:2'-5' RNA ligase
MRLFFAVFLPPAVAGRVARLGAGFAGGAVRWIAPANLHYTLRFLGEVPDTHLPLFLRAGQEAAARCAPFRLEITGAGFFPAGGRASVFWLGAGGNAGRLTALSARLEAALARQAFPPSGEGFSPHLTVARIRGRLAETDRVRLEARARGFRAVFPVNGLILAGSTLAPGGAVYRVVGRFPLGVADAA